MTRITIWRWLSQGVPAGQILPPWLVACSAVLFPRRFLLWWLQRDCGFDLMGGWWTIHGVRFSDSVFMAMAQPRSGVVYRFDRDPKSSLVTIHEIRLPTPESQP